MKDEVELATTSISIGGKRFSLDVKENRIGRFVKIRESDGSGSANKVILPSGGALAFHDALRKFTSQHIADKAFIPTPSPLLTSISHCLQAAPPSVDGRPPAIHSEYVQVDTKKFHLDLFENSRG